MMRVYLSGPMTALPYLNFPAFMEEARRLRKLGYDVVNPVDINPDQDAEWADCLRADLRELLTCDTIAMLPGWQNSRGAKLERYVAKELGMPCVDSYSIKQPAGALAA